MKQRDVIKSRIRGIGFHIGVDKRFGNFVIYDSGKIDRQGKFIGKVDQHELPYIGVLMAMKNALIHFRNGVVEFENEAGDEVWQIKVFPISDRAKGICKELYDKEPPNDE